METYVRKVPRIATKLFGSTERRIFPLKVTLLSIYSCLKGRRIRKVNQIVKSTLTKEIL